MPGGSPATPPRALERWLAHRLGSGEGARFVIGDLREEFAHRAEGRGRGHALLWFSLQCLSLGLGLRARRLRRSVSPHRPRPGATEMIASVFQDLRYGLRSLVKAPLFTLSAVVTIALGVGANAAVFSMVDAVLLDPLPFPQPERLVRVYSAYPERDIWRGTLSPQNFRDLRDQSSTLESMTVFPALTLSGFVLTGGDRPDRVEAHYVGEGFFETLGTPPLLGRTIGDADQADGANSVVVLTHGAWQARFGADPEIVGRTIRLSDRPFRVIGVMPPDFDYPTPGAELWVPLSIIPESGIPRRRSVPFLGALARLAPGVGVEQARADLSAVARRLAEEYPDSNGQLTEIAVVPLHEQMTGGSRAALLALFGAVGLVLLICCVNVANLLLVRAQGRTRELAVRSALGAGRGRLVRQLITEASLLAAIGGTLGLLLGALALRALIAVAPADIPRLASVGIDPTVVAFTLGLSLFAGLLFGLAPAWRAWRGDLQAELKLAAGAGGDTDRRSRVRGLLVVAEVALVVVLAIGAGLLLRTLGALLDVEPGFEVERAVSMQVTAPGYLLDSSEEISRYYTELLDEVRAVPGVVAAGVVRPMPMAPDTFQGEGLTFSVVGDPLPPEGQEPRIALRHASRDLFEAMGVPLLAGRDFDSRDDVGAGTMRGIVNAALVERFFPDGDAVGRRLRMGRGELEIVGVVSDIRQTALDEETSNVVYVPITQSTRVGMSLVVRTRQEPATLLGSLQDAIWRVNPDQPIENVATLDALVRESVSERRFSALLLVLFAALALTLATVGIYGVVASAVAQRNREIGIRMALGARAGDVTRWVVTRGMTWVAIGIVLGLVLASLASRALSSMLYGVAVTDLPTYGAVAGLLALVAVVASLVPARRAVGIDPVRALASD